MKITVRVLDSETKLYLVYTYPTINTYTSLFFFLYDLRGQTSDDLLALVCPVLQLSLARNFPVIVLCTLHFHIWGRNRCLCFATSPICHCQRRQQCAAVSHVVVEVTIPFQGNLEKQTMNKYLLKDVSAQPLIKHISPNVFEFCRLILPIILFVLIKF